MFGSIKDRITLNDGNKMPRLGLGVYKAKDGEEVESAVTFALKIGYRLIDTAAIYFNEMGVGNAVNQSKIPRNEIFITTKLWNDKHGFNEALQAFYESLKKLSMDYVDLYLIHWPVGAKIKETWKAFEKLHKEGFTRSIGVSNFLEHHLKDLIHYAEIVPSVNQIEFHPYLQQKELVNYCKNKGIIVEAWSPLARGRLFDDPVILMLSEKYGKTPAQIILRWAYQLDIVTIPKSVHERRIKENASIFDFNIEENDMKKIEALDRGEKGRFGPHPDSFK
jgi:diketogulonate reductase-like aldo/keto reductase